MIGKLSSEDVECLVMWPSGSRGEQNERIVLKRLLQLCNENGYGRVSQLAEQIEDIWRNEEEAKIKYQKHKDGHLAFMEKCKEEME